MSKPSAKSVQGEQNNKTPRVGDAAPDATLTDTSGAQVALSSYWRKKPVVLLFLRHFGCPFCREQVARLRNQYEKFVEAGAEVICVGMGSYKAGKAFSVYFDLPFPVLVCGDDQSIYAKYGLNKGKFSQLFGFAVLLRGLSAIRHGFGPLEGDPNQMPGTFIVGVDSKILFVRRAKNQADNVATDELLAVLAASAQLVKPLIDGES